MLWGAQRTRRDPTASARRAWMRSSASPPQPGVAGSTRCWTPIRWPASRSTTDPVGRRHPLPSTPPRHRPFTPPRRRDTTPDSRRQAFVAGAGRPDAGTTTWNRYFLNTTLNEEWASQPGTAQRARARGDTEYLGALDSPHSSRPTAGSSSWKTGSPRSSGQTTDSALGVVTRASTAPGLPPTYAARHFSTWTSWSGQIRNAGRR
jgi:hypothetical protein